MRRSIVQVVRVASNRAGFRPGKFPMNASVLSVTAGNGPQFARYKSTAAATYDQSIDSFPSIVIGPNGSIIPQGSFAEAQAEVGFHYPWGNLGIGSKEELTLYIFFSNSTWTQIQMPWKL